GGDEVQGGDVLEVAVGDEGRRGVADDGDQDLREGEGVAAGEVGGGEDGDAADAQSEAGQAAGAQGLRGAEEAGQQDADDGHARDQQAGRGAGQVPFGVGEGVPGRDDLDDGEGQHGLQAGPQVPGQARLAQGEGQQEGGAEGAAGEDDRGRGHLVHGHFDQQVGDPPDQAHQGEQEPAACSHAVSVAAV